ncbi:MAG: hypothetical protein AAGF75_10390, partial [Cyanobacteria bacterium P01_H01_bin.130]
TLNNNSNNNNGNPSNNNAENNNADNWTRAFNQEVAQRQMTAMVEHMMAMASQVQEQIQQQMQQQANAQGAGMGMPSPGMPSGVPQGDVLRDSETALIITLALPGLKEDSIKLEVQDQLLRVTGELDATAVVPPGFPVPPTLGFTRMVPLPVAVDSDRPTITTTETGLSIILPKVEPGILTNAQLRQAAQSSMAAHPMAGIVEAMLQGMSNQTQIQPGFPFAPRRPQQRPLQDRLNTWKNQATQTFQRWGKAIAETVSPAISEMSDRTAEFGKQSERHQQLMDRWTESRRWMGQQLKTLGDRLSK